MGSPETLLRVCVCVCVCLSGEVSSRHQQHFSLVSSDLASLCKTKLMNRSVQCLCVCVCVCVFMHVSECHLHSIFLKSLQHGVYNVCNVRNVCNVCNVRNRRKARNACIVHKVCNVRNVRKVCKVFNVRKVCKVRNVRKVCKVCKVCNGFNVRKVCNVGKVLSPACHRATLKVKLRRKRELFSFFPLSRTNVNEA